MDIADIKQAFKDNDVPLAASDAWKVQQSWVIYHKAIERLGAALKIQWDEVRFLRVERDECVVFVKATRPDKGISEWSTGEALIGVNYKVSGKQAAYVYAMAEKRGKDRCILKLAGLHGAYSEDEADDFKRENRTDDGEPDAPRDRNPDKVVPMKQAEKAINAKVVDGVKVDEDGVVQEDAANGQPPTAAAVIASIKAEIDALADEKDGEGIYVLMTKSDAPAKAQKFGKSAWDEVRMYANGKLKEMNWTVAAKPQAS